MLKIKKYCSIIALGTMILMTSCMDVSSNDTNADSVDLGPLLAKQELFEKKLNQIVKKIDNLQTSVNKIKTASPTADNKKNDKPTRKPSDPNYVHNIPQGNSYFIGNPDAKVTITEFFDFQ